jgi:hypothetical protein
MAEERASASSTRRSPAGSDLPHRPHRLGARYEGAEQLPRRRGVHGRYGTGFALGLLAKDVGIAATLAESVGISAPALDLVQRQWAEAAAGLGFAADHSEAHKQWLPTDLTSSD